jgi:hypothetical protein
MKKPIKVVMLLASDQTYQVKKGEYFINDSREHSWGKLELLRAERVTSHGHVWDGDSIKPYIHYLYITVSQPIKSGDWCINKELEIFQVKIDIISEVFNARKIIATTDPKLHYKGEFNEKLGRRTFADVPQVSQSCLKEFVANPGGEYEVEYLTGHSEDRLKLNKDNEVNITYVGEKMYSRDEVKVLITRFHIMTDGTRAYEEKWIKENL